MLSDRFFSCSRAKFSLHGITIFDSIKSWCPANGLSFSWCGFRFLVYFSSCQTSRKKAVMLILDSNNWLSFNVLPTFKMSDSDVMLCKES